MPASDAALKVFRENLKHFSLPVLKDCVAKLMDSAVNDAGNEGLKIGGLSEMERMHEYAKEIERRKNEQRN